MLRRIDLRGAKDDVEQLLPRRADPGVTVAEAVSSIIDDVRAGGDDALRRLTKRFDGVELSSLVVAPSEIERALAEISGDLRDALRYAYDRIVAYHGHEPQPLDAFVDGGVTVEHREVPVERVGCYAPGGLARYPSSVLMCAAPARVAGVGTISLCVPPTPNGGVDDTTLAAAAIAGIDVVHPVGGAQAIAALALGTESVDRVDIVAGPGNSYVAEAKRQLSGTVGVAAAFAGPSEIVVIADASTPPELAAIDLMVQAEHGPDGMAWLVTWDPGVASAVDAALDTLVAHAPRRAELEATMATNGVVCLVDGPEQAIAVSNVVAPEHLELLVDDYADMIDSITAAGAVFCGLDAPASLGDYAIGTNHILPTDRSARFASALRADDFRRHIHVVEVDRDAFLALGPVVERLATIEGLDAHAESIRMRR